MYWIILIALLEQESTEIGEDSESNLDEKSYPTQVVKQVGAIMNYNS